MTSRNLGLADFCLVVMPEHDGDEGVYNSGLSVLACLRSSLHPGRDPTASSQQQLACHPCVRLNFSRSIPGVAALQGHGGIKFGRAGSACANFRRTTRRRGGARRERRVPSARAIAFRQPARRAGILRCRNRLGGPAPTSREAPAGAVRFGRKSYTIYPNISIWYLDARVAHPRPLPASSSRR